MKKQDIIKRIKDFQGELRERKQSEIENIYSSGGVSYRRLRCSLYPMSSMSNSVSSGELPDKENISIDIMHAIIQVGLYMSYVVNNYDDENWRKLYIPAIMENVNEISNTFSQKNTKYPVYIDANDL